MSDEYLKFLDGVHRLAGVDLRQYKREQMERRIRSYVARQQPAPSGLDGFLHSLRGDALALDGFLDRVTINVSELYRNPEQWDVLRDRVLNVIGGTGPLRVWSAGCSYGAEAYTLACVIGEALPARRLEIVGTDIDKRILARAERGWFSQGDMRGVPPKVRARHFAPSDDGWQANDALRRVVRFRREDLLDTRSPGTWDLVLCRNVVIYFNEEARNAVHARIAASIRPGGFLMVGATERVADPRPMGLTQAFPFIYRKTGE